MTLKLKINPYDTLFIAKFQIFSYQRQDSSCPIRASISASRHKWKQIGSNHWNELQSKIRTLRRNPVIRWPMTLLSSIKVNALMKIKTSISLKNAIFFIFYNRRIIFFLLRITTVMTNRWALTLQSRASFYKHTAKSSQPPGHS